MSVSNSASRSRVSRMASAGGAALVSGVFTRRRLWIGPVVAAVVIVCVGWWANRSATQAVQTNVEGQLQALLNADIAALQVWIEERRLEAESTGQSQPIRQSILELVQLAERSESDQLVAQLLTSEAQDELRKRMQPMMDARRIEGYVVVDEQSLILARHEDTVVGDPSIAKAFQSTLMPVFEGNTVVIPPFPSILPKKTADGSFKSGVPAMSVAGPVRSSDGKVVASICLILDPERAFTKILQVARAGESGETYAFNAKGVMVTGSRFDDELKRIGLLLDDEESRSILSVQIRDPGVDLTQGLRSEENRPNQPLTRMAASAIAGETGVDVDGYRDYRGVPVVGAWTWLPEQQIGVATEVDYAEAFGPLQALRRAFALLLGILSAASIGLFGLAFYASKLERQARRASIEAKRLGQYALDEQIGEGGMGVVYKAHHDMLHRPTAVKLLHVDKMSEDAVARFEREVQLTSQLSHPNTIAIYDYGRTPEGVFYYAMEYLDGISLEDLVERYGPLPDERVVAILRQLCGSLAEAHGLDLIHRDIKPANIMLTKLGGMHDFVKLLDFGLAKPQNTDRNITMAGSLTGTPLYLSPEAIQHHELDARSDLYAVGAVAFFLLTGRPVFDGKSIVDICTQHLKAEPPIPSTLIGRTVDADLERLLLSCLAKKPRDRPESAFVLEQELSRSSSANAWTQSDAKAWWESKGNADTKVSVNDTVDLGMTEPAINETLDPNQGQSI